MESESHKSCLYSVHFKLDDNVGYWGERSNKSEIKNESFISKMNL